MPFVWLLFIGSSLAADPANEEGDNTDEWPEDTSVSVDHVNEGELEFLDAAKLEKHPHHHHNELTLLPGSLEHGWIAFRQCHENIDAVPRLEVMFRPNRVRRLSVLEKHNIESAVARAHSVELTNIGKPAKLCLSGELKLIETLANGDHRLSSGPFMRRFFDGYFPMRVTWSLDRQETGIALGVISPGPQPGFSVKRTQDRIEIDTLFEGRLMIQLQLR